jgi:hypothetical protein
MSHGQHRPDVAASIAGERYPRQRSTECDGMPRCSAAGCPCQPSDVAQRILVAIVEHDPGDQRRPPRPDQDAFKNSSGLSRPVIAYSGGRTRLRDCQAQGRRREDRSCRASQTEGDHEPDGCPASESCGYAEAPAGGLGPSQIRRRTSQAGGAQQGSAQSGEVTRSSAITDRGPKQGPRRRTG